VEALEDRTVLSFAAVPPSFPTGPDPHAVVAADFAGSGRLDLAVVNEQSNTVSVFPGNGDGAFQPKVDYTVGTDPDALAAGDFNGDGRPDLAVVNLTGSVSVLLNGGAGAFLPAVGFAVPSGSHSVAVADFNGDGHADLVVNHSLLLGNGDGTFQPAHARRQRRDRGNGGLQRRRQAGSRQCRSHRAGIGVGADFARQRRRHLPGSAKLRP